MDGYTHFLTRTREKAAAEMSLNVLIYNFKRVLNIIGIVHLMAALKAYLDRVTLTIGHNPLLNPQFDYTGPNLRNFTLFELRNTPTAENRGPMHASKCVFTQHQPCMTLQNRIDGEDAVERLRSGVTPMYSTLVAQQKVAELARALISRA